MKHKNYNDAVAAEYRAKAEGLDLALFMMRALESEWTKTNKQYKMRGTRSAFVASRMKRYLKSRLAEAQQSEARYNKLSVEFEQKYGDR